MVSEPSNDLTFPTGPKGFALTAADGRKIGESMTRFGWIYFLLGNLLLLLLCALQQLVTVDPMKTAVAAFSWLFTRLLNFILQGTVVSGLKWREIDAFVS